ncbi:hypothetical protein BJX70DRAFT_401574 [Aspergillus crustosus]
MARTKQTAKRHWKEIITWTRFHLPQEQEWPTWSVDHADIHIGPLADVSGRRKVSLGRMVEAPEKVAYIIEWATLDDLQAFLSSPACAEFLRNLPEDDNSRASIDSGTALRHLALNDDPSSSTSASRFLTFQHASEAPTGQVEGRVTFTSFLVPQIFDNPRATCRDTFMNAFSIFVPRNSESITYHRNFNFRFSAVWFWLLAEDHHMEEVFGKTTDNDDASYQGEEGRTIFCHFWLWASRYGATPEHEEASAADPQARESWEQAIAKVMPPATDWVQERWDIQPLPRFYPPEPEIDPEEDPEWVAEQERLWSEYFRFHGLKRGLGDPWIFRIVALQVIHDKKLEGQLTDHSILITGVSSRIGLKTARALFATGATLYLTARNLEKAQIALGEELAQSPRVHLLHLDLESLDSVRACITKLLSKTKELNILIANAGVMATPEGRTKDGFETQQSKCALLWAANEIDQRYASLGLRAFIMQPGRIQTGLLQYMSEEETEGLASDPTLDSQFKSPEQGAATSVVHMEVGAAEGGGGDANNDIGTVDDRGSGHGHDGDIVGCAAIDNSLHCQVEGHGAVGEAEAY